MPENLCFSCMANCGIIVNSDYLQKFLFAWTFDQPFPNCDFYKEVSFHGLEGTRP
jgi:hypothetical protein